MLFICPTTGYDADNSGKSFDMVAIPALKNSHLLDVLMLMGRIRRRNFLQVVSGIYHKDRPHEASVVSTVYRNLPVQLCIAELVTDMSHDSCRMRGNPLRGICSKSPTGLSIGGSSGIYASSFRCLHFPLMSSSHRRRLYTAGWR